MSNQETIEVDEDFLTSHIILLNGRPLRSCIKFNIKEGWVEVPDLKALGVPPTDKKIDTLAPPPKMIEEFPVIRKTGVVKVLNQSPKELLRELSVKKQ